MEKSQYDALSLNTNRTNERNVFLEELLEKYYTGGGQRDLIGDFPKYCSRASLTRLLGRYEVFKKVQNVQGYIMECGVFRGSGLFSWAKFSSIFEPCNNARRIVGFDTFEGFPELKEQDALSAFKKGELDASGAYEEIQDCIRLHDLDRFISDVPRMEVIKGNACQTIPQYMADNPHLMVALLYLDFDVYEPTKVALETFVPRMPKGAIIAFDHIGCKHTVGETIALEEVIGISKLKIERFAFDSMFSYVQL